MLRRVWVIAAFATLGLQAVPAGAQNRENGPRFPMFSMGSIGAELLMAHPRGELRENAGIGFGFGGHGLLAIDKWGIGGLRLDLGLINYGSETKRYECGQFCFYEATTTNNIINMQVGGQLVMPRKYILPYVGASYGALWFTTDSRVETDSDNPSPFRHNVRSGDATGSYMFASGVYFPMGGALAGLTGNIGARVFTGGYARYLTPKSLRREADGSYTVTSYTSHTEFLVIHIGVSSSMGPKKSRPSVRE